MSLFHPRLTEKLVGHEAAWDFLYRLYEQGKVSPCWILNGPRGIGKATFAYQFARRILVQNTQNPLGLQDPLVARQIKANSYPNLWVLEKPIEEGEEAQEIPLSQAKKILDFLGQTPRIPGWRVVIIDAADELNRSAGNCLLKILEEPPAQTLIFLISHAWGQVLATLRSRCQRYDLYPLEKQDLVSFYHNQEEIKDPLFQISQGSIGRYQQLLQAGGEEFLNSLKSMITLARRGQWVHLQKFCQDIAKIPEKFETLLWVLPFLVYRYTLSCSLDVQEEWLLIWQKLTHFLVAAKDRHLDKNQLLLGCFLVIENPYDHVGSLSELKI